ncbi:hypothetical protein BZL43_07700 [Pseudomonas sp. PICF141]|nr:hypothetical protein BZL43_07700 [Pseudomonas sp. PICF141]
MLKMTSFGFRLQYKSMKKNIKHTQAKSTTQKITMEEYLKEESKNLFTPQEALDHLRSESKLEVSELAPCKGQTIFNPKFSYLK